MQSVRQSPRGCAAGRFGARARRGKLAKEGRRLQRVPVAALRGDFCPKQSARRPALPLARMRA
eukprot:6196667-Lingulodinium_polyedra.AAC.1